MLDKVLAHVQRDTLPHSPSFTASTSSYTIIFMYRHCPCSVDELLEMLIRSIRDAPTEGCPETIHL